MHRCLKHQSTGDTICETRLYSLAVSQDATQALVALLQSLFSTEELRRFVRYLPQGEQIENGLPSGSASLTAVVSETVAALRRRGHLDDAFFELLVAERPGRRTDIVEIQTALRDLRVIETTHARPSARPTSAAMLGTYPETFESEELSILCMPANAAVSSQFGFARTVQSMRKKLHRAARQQRVKIVSAWTTRLVELQQALLENEAQVVHFIGRCGDEGIGLLDKDGTPTTLRPNRLARLFAPFQRHLRVLVLDQCSSLDLPSLFVEHVSVVVSGPSDTDGQTALEFISSFYRALGFGHSVQAAFELSTSIINTESEAPQPEARIHVNDAFDPQYLVLVKTAATSSLTGRRESGTDQLRLEFFNLDTSQETSFIGNSVDEHAARTDIERMHALEQVIEQENATHPDDSNIRALKAKLSSWIPLNEGDLLITGYSHGESGQFKMPTLLFTIHNTDPDMIVLHTIETNFFDRSRHGGPVFHPDGYHRTLLTSRALVPLADYRIDVAAGTSSMIPNTVIAPGDMVSIRVQLELTIHKDFSMHIRLLGSSGARIESGPIHVRLNASR